MSELKPFLINIEGTYCEVPHKDRKMLLFNDSDESLEDAERDMDQITQNSLKDWDD